MNNKVLIICAYFGKLPNYIQLWLNSCSHNKEFNWLVVTDDEVKNLIIPSNVTFFEMTLDEMKTLILEKTGLSYNNKTPYKLCDFKPIYGEIFEDFLKDYTHWGHCDLDMIYGDLGRYINDNILNQYDKIYEHGHLTLYKNNKNVNERYKLRNPYFNYKYILENKKHYGFDEHRGIPRLYRHYNIDYYKNSGDFADINPRYYHFTTLNIDTEKQYFYWSNGKVFRNIEMNGKVEKEEFMYIHFQKRNMPINFNNSSSNNSYYITNKGFINMGDYKANFDILNERSLIKNIKRKILWEKLKLRGVYNTIFYFKECPKFIQPIVKKLL